VNRLSKLIEAIVEFRDNRDWEQFHTPRNLAAAIAVKAGELQEQFLWREDGYLPGSARREEVSEKIADVLIYALLFCHELGIDPERAVRTKLEENRDRYPVEKARGRSTKYTKLEDS